MKKKIDEQSIHKTYYDQIHNQVKKDPYVNVLGIELTNFEAGLAKAKFYVKIHMVKAHRSIHRAVIYAYYASSATCNAYGKTSLALLSKRFESPPGF